MKLRVLGVLSVLSVLIVIFASTAILTSASRELTQELQINRAAALNRLAQVAFDAATDGGDASQLQTEMDRYSELYGEGVLVRLQAGTLRSGGLTEERADVRDALARAGLNLNDTTLAPLQPFGTGTEVISTLLRQRKPGSWRGGPGRQPGCGPAEAAGTVARRRSGCGRPRGGAAPRRRPRDQVGAASRAPPEFGGNGA